MLLEIRPFTYCGEFRYCGFSYAVKDELWYFCKLTASDMCVFIFAVAGAAASVLVALLTPPKETPGSRRGEENG